jgi:hypothetical protein
MHGACTALGVHCIALVLCWYCHTPWAHRHHDTLLLLLSTWHLLLVVCMRVAMLLL